MQIIIQEICHINLGDEYYEVNCVTKRKTFPGNEEGPVRQDLTK